MYQQYYHQLGFFLNMNWVSRIEYEGKSGGCSLTQHFSQVLFGDTESGVRRPLNSVDEEESDWGIYHKNTKTKPIFIIKDFLWNHFINWCPPPPPPRPPFMKSYLFIFSSIFWAKKEVLLKVVWMVLMGVLRVLEGCCRVFEVCLEGVWKNKIEV